MKTKILPFLLLAATLTAADLTTKSGKNYYDYEIISISGSECVIQHSTGTVTLPLSEIPVNVLEDYFKQVLEAAQVDNSAEDDSNNAASPAATVTEDGESSEEEWQVAQEAAVFPDDNGNISLLLVEDGWIGSDNRIDYYKLNISDSGVYSFVLGYLEGDARLTLYVQDNDKLEKLKFAYGKSGKDGIIRNQFLENGNYYLSVEASGRTVSEGTGYAVGVYGKVTTEEAFESKREKAIEDTQSRARANARASEPELPVDDNYSASEWELRRSLRHSNKIRNEHVRFQKQFNERRFIER